MTFIQCCNRLGFVAFVFYPVHKPALMKVYNCNHALNENMVDYTVSDDNGKLYMKKMMEKS